MKNFGFAPVDFGEKYYVAFEVLEKGFHNKYYIMCKM